MFNTGKYFYKPILECESELVGAKLVDIAEEGKILTFEDAEGRQYTVDTTGKDGAVVHKHLTDSERLMYLEEYFEALLTKFNMTDDDLHEILSR